MSTAHRVIGKRLPKVDALARCTGATVYADDITRPDMLVGKLLRSPYAHARVGAVDTRRAQDLPGVHAAITGQDLPHPYGILPVSQNERALALDKVRYIGEPVAAVAAVDEETAERALALIRVSYEPLEEITSISEALQTDRPLLHGEGNGLNVDRTVALEFGDVDEGFAEADFVREDTFLYRGSSHAAIEQHATVASPGSDGRLTVWSSTQVPHYLHRTLARVLEVPASRIRVVGAPVGGGFGGKSDLFSHEFVAAELAIVTGRPVKITLTREEVFYAHRGRHPVLMWIKTGFRTDGRITSMHFRSYLEGGAYGGYGAATTYYTGVLQTATYRIPHYKFEGVRVFTNKPPCGPKRGHGTPQPRFALECHLDKAAEDLRIDPVSLRLRNAVKPFSTTVNHLRITSCGLEECMREVVEASGFRHKHGRARDGRGVGFAIGAYLSGAGLPIYWNDMPQSEVQVKVDRGGGVTVYSMAADIGQGSTSVLAAIVAEILGLEPGDLSVVTADTDLTPVDLGSYSSRVTFMAGNAALEAARKIRELVITAAAEQLGAPADEIVVLPGRVAVGGASDRAMSWTQAVQWATARSGPLVAVGSYRPPDLAGPYKGSGVGPSPAYSYSACVAEVRCDTETGDIEVEKVWLAHDIGRAINPILAEGQIEGSVHMAVGEALMEEQAFRGPLHRGPSMLDYKIPTVLEMPAVDSILVETDDPEGPFGAKEIGQGPLLPVVPAIANAVHDALGLRIDEVPLTPERIIRAGRDFERTGHDRAGPDEITTFVFPEAERVDRPLGFVEMAR